MKQMNGNLAVFCINEKGLALARPKSVIYY